MRGVLVVAPLELFDCTPLSTKLSRSACAQRHKQAKRDARGERGPQRSAKLIGWQRCTSCPIGEAHARGEAPTKWEGGAAITIVAASIPSPGSSRWLGEKTPRSEERLDPAVAHFAPSDTDDDRCAPPSAKRAHEETSMVAPKMITHEGRTLSISDWSRQPEIKALGLTMKTIASRLARGASPKEALTSPRHQGRPMEHSQPRAKKGSAGSALAETVKRAEPVRTIEHVIRRSPPAELLVAAGYSVTETKCPRGVVLIVEIGEHA